MGVEGGVAGGHQGGGRYWQAGGAGLHPGHVHRSCCLQFGGMGGWLGDWMVSRVGGLLDAVWEWATRPALGMPQDMHAARPSTHQPTTPCILYASSAHLEALQAEVVLAGRLQAGK